ncbi:Cytochrome c oxidase subunit 2 precursor [Anoxybacillus sp. BCO1]|nr:Cytochrome c oxidase subunit 2 precursor [Anoxybacillus sp. BCO1]
MDTNTDNTNQFFLTFDDKRAEEAGRLFYGKCAELCGPSHALMDFKVKALPRAEFDQWVEKMKNAKPVAATDPVVKRGEEIFNKSCIGCHAVTPVDGRPEQARLAPNLADFADRSRIAGILEHNEENLKAWLKDPEKIKPGNKMTGTYPALSDEELEALTKYLMTLSVE